MTGCDQSIGISSRSDNHEKIASIETQLDSVFSLTGDEEGLGATDPDLLVEQRGGDFVLVDRRDQIVAVYDSTGRAKARIGRRGKGPGEFEDIEGVFSLPGDTMMIFDRTRQIGYLYHEYKPTNARIDFREWRFTERRGQTLVGRFADGRWVAYAGSPRLLFKEGVRAGTDSVHLVAGKPNVSPVRLASVAEIKQVDLLTEGYSYRFDLNEIAPGTGAVCENGVILADTSGVRRLSVAGKDAWAIPHQMPRTPIERYGGIDGVVERQLSVAVSGALSEKARAALREFGAKADSAMNPVLIDARGAVWYARPGAKRGTAYVLFSDRKELQERFLASGAYRVGSRFLFNWSPDPELEVPRYTVFRLPSSIDNAQTDLGWCYSQFRW